MPASTESRDSQQKQHQKSLIIGLNLNLRRDPHIDPHIGIHIWLLAGRTRGNGAMAMIGLQQSILGASSKPFQPAAILTLLGGVQLAG